MSRFLLKRHNLRSTPWYMSGGVALANVVGAYQAIGADDLATSYVNLAAPGTRDLTVPSAAPTWAAETGWTFNGSSQYLLLPYAVADGRTHTVIIRFDGVTGSTGYMCGYYLGSAVGFTLTPNRSTWRKYYNGNAAAGVNATKASGIMAIAAGTSYLDGVSDGAITLAANACTAENFYVGASSNGGGGVHTYYGGRIQALALYNTELTPAQVAAVTSAMGGLGEPEITFVVLPDQQSNVSLAPANLTTIANWIVAKKDIYNIGAVLMVGDLINGGGESGEFATFDTNMLDVLDAGNIPWFAAHGNHDVDDGTNPIPRATSLDDWNTTIPQARYAAQSGWSGGFYEASHSENAYRIIGNYLIFVLEFGPRDAVMDWVVTTCAANATKTAIVITHSCEYSDGSFTTTGDNHNPHTYYGAGDANDGQEMWNGWLKTIPNLRWIHNGHHVETTAAHHEATGDNGNTVEACFSNWQNNGNGYLVLLKIYDSGATWLYRTLEVVAGTQSLVAADHFDVAF